MTQKDGLARDSSTLLCMVICTSATDSHDCPEIGCLPNPQIHAIFHPFSLLAYVTLLSLFCDPAGTPKTLIPSLVPQYSLSVLRSDGIYNLYNLLEAAGPPL